MLHYERMSSRRSRLNIRHWLSAGVIGLLMCGCTNLSAVREFADISSATAEHTWLVSEYVSWPAKQKKYYPESEHGNLDDLGKERSNHEKILLLRHSLIEEYMDALGQLADNGLVIYDNEIDKLGTAATKEGLFDDKEKTAFGSIATILSRAVTDTWRQHRLKQLIREANEPLQVVIAALKQIVDEGFLGDVRDEERAINKYYRNIINESKDKAGITALEEWQKSRLASLSKQEKAIKAYSQSLTNISDGHQKLYDELDRIQTKELLAALSRYAKELRKGYNTISKF